MTFNTRPFPSLRCFSDRRILDGGLVELWCRGAVQDCVMEHGVGVTKRYVFWCIWWLSYEKCDKRSQYCNQDDRVVKTRWLNISCVAQYDNKAVMHIFVLLVRLIRSLQNMADYETLLDSMFDCKYHGWKWLHLRNVFCQTMRRTETMTYSIQSKTTQEII